MPETIRSEINVTPLVDVCLVLLIIFLVVTPMITESVALPRTKAPSRKPDDGRQVSLVVSYSPSPVISIDDERLSKAGATARLAKIYRRSPGKAVVVKADRRLRWGDVKGALKMTNRAGFESVGVIAEKKVRAK
jgi:biopolymer transport protein TolR